MTTSNNVEGSGEFTWASLASLVAAATKMGKLLHCLLTLHINKHRVQGL